MPRISESLHATNDQNDFGKCALQAKQTCSHLHFVRESRQLLCGLEVAHADEGAEGRLVAEEAVAVNLVGADRDVKSGRLAHVCGVWVCIVGGWVRCVWLCIRAYVRV